MSVSEEQQPAGGENLEVMQEAQNYNRFLRDLVRRYGENPAAALDFGAGIGTFSDAPGLPTDQMHCVETDTASRKVLAEKDFCVHSSLATVPDNSIDYAFTLNVLEHIEDHEEAVRELHRVLRPGGRLFVYVPAFQCLFTSMDRHVGHVRRYRRPALNALVAGAGFEIEGSGYTDALGFFATLLLRLFDSDEPGPLNPGLVRLYDRVAFPLSRLLSVPLRYVLGKNAWVVARRKMAP